MAFTKWKMDRTGPFHPQASLVGGVLQGFAVRCLSPEVQVLCHAHGYVPTEKDFRDMELIEARFGLELPPQLRRNKD